MSTNKEAPRFFSRLPEQFGGKIPFIVTDLIDQLRSMNAVEVEGLFRLNGGAREMTELTQQLDKGRVQDWSQYKNVHTIACCLKKYFREMVPYNPLFPHDVYQDLISIPQLRDQDVQAAKFKEVLAKLSKPRQMTIIYLFQYILEVEANKEKNKMNAQNLAIVFSPNLICSLPANETDASQTITNNTLQNKLITTLVTIGHKIFDGVETADAKIIDSDIPIIAVPPIAKQDIEKFVSLRDLRRRSYIPYVPQDMFYDPRFVRPTREVTFPDEETS